MTKLENAKKLVRQMSAKEREELIAYIKVNRQFGRQTPVEEAASDDMASMILEMICSTLAGLGLEYTKPHGLISTQAYRAFRRKISVDEIDRWIKEVAGKNRARQRAFVRLAVSLLCNNLIAMNETTNSRTLMAQIHRLQGVVNDNFPGYAEAGLMSLIITQQQRDH